VFNTLTDTILSQFITTFLLTSIRLLGKLNFVAQCVKPGRIFISRLLNWLREISDKGSFCIPLDLKIDLLWWNTFLQFKQLCKKEFLDAPVFNTLTDTILSQFITTFLLTSIRPHNFKATTIVNISHTGLERYRIKVRFAFL
jgi:hypothetical protein